MFINTRSSGVLMHISSLPGPFGIGVLGKEALDFIDLISNLGFSYWQILSVNPIDEFNSPYKSSSAFAGNYIFIDPRSLKSIGLISQDEVDTCICKHSTRTADYDFVSKNRLALLKVAFSRINKTMLSSIDEFSKKNKWVESYALYMAIKESQDDSPWWKWDYGFDDYEYCKLQHEKFTQQINFWKFTQYIFYSQLSIIKNYANINGIKIIVDMPFYISMDSCDVWSNSYYFQLDLDTLKPLRVAGSPPNSFSESGHIIGNTLYNWENLKEEGYSWWISRLKFYSNNFDIIKITDYCDFYSYWSVPVNAKTASQGKWDNDPEHNFIKLVYNLFPNINIIADDRNYNSDNLNKLLNINNIPNIRVLQSGFTDMNNNINLTYNYPKNTVAYLGTHNDNTFLGFLHNLSKEKRKFVLDYCSFRGDDWSKEGSANIACRCAFETLWRSPALLTIISIQDICGMGSQARMNTPGTKKYNWLFRVTKENLKNIDCTYIKHLNCLFKR